MPPATGGAVEGNFLLHPSPTALAADPRQPSTVYTGISGVLLEPPGNISQVYRTTDGVTWSLVPGLSDLYPARAFAFPPAEPGVVYAGLQGAGVFVSEDDGETWRAVNQGLPSYTVVAMAVGAGSPGTVYAATPAASPSWSALPDGLS